MGHIVKRLGPIQKERCDDSAAPAIYRSASRRRRWSTRTATVSRRATPSNTEAELVALLAAVFVSRSDAGVGRQKSIPVLKQFDHADDVVIEPGRFLDPFNYSR